MNIILLPGFFYADSSMQELCDKLNRHGEHTAETWGLGKNLGFSVKELADQRYPVVVKARDMQAANGQGVILVGWSLGGIIARILVQLHPDMFVGLVTMGTALRISLRSCFSGWLLYQLIGTFSWINHGRTMDQNVALIRELGLDKKPDVPCLTIAGEKDFLPLQDVLEGEHQHVLPVGHFALPRASYMPVRYFADTFARHAPL